MVTFPYVIPAYAVEREVIEQNCNIILGNTLHLDVFTSDFGVWGERVITDRILLPLGKGRRCTW